jgi:hypothetical protein
MWSPTFADPGYRVSHEIPLSPDPLYFILLHDEDGPFLPFQHLLQGIMDGRVRRHAEIDFLQTF